MQHSLEAGLRFRLFYLMLRMKVLYTEISVNSKLLTVSNLFLFYCQVQGQTAVYGSTALCVIDMFLSGVGT